MAYIFSCLIMETKPLARVGDKCSFSPILSMNSVPASSMASGCWWENALIKMAMMPLVTIILAHFFVVNERITLNKAVGFGLGFIGILILMSADIDAGRVIDWTVLMAMLSILCGAVSYAANSVIAHQLPKISLSLISLGVLSFSSIITMSVWLFLYGLDGFTSIVESTDAAIYSVILLGIFPTGLATIVYFSVIRQAGAAFLSQINYFKLSLYIWYCSSVQISRLLSFASNNAVILAFRSSAFL